MRSGPFSPAACAKAGVAARTIPSNPNVRDFIKLSPAAVFCCREIAAAGETRQRRTKTRTSRGDFMSKCSIAIAALLGAMAISASDSWAQEQTVWKFNNLSRIGGLTPTVEGAPALVDSPVGKAVQFNGADTGLFFSGRPLVGAKTFTIEAIFRPEGGEF